MPVYTDNYIIDGIKKGDNKVISHIYSKYYYLILKRHRCRSYLREKIINDPKFKELKYEI